MSFIFNHAHFLISWKGIYSPRWSGSILFHFCFPFKLSVFRSIICCLFWEEKMLKDLLAAEPWSAGRKGPCISSSLSNISVSHGLRIWHIRKHKFNWMEVVADDVHFTQCCKLQQNYLSKAVGAFWRTCVPGWCRSHWCELGASLQGFISSLWNQFYSEGNLADGQPLVTLCTESEMYFICQKLDPIIS